MLGVTAEKPNSALSHGRRGGLNEHVTPLETRLPSCFYVSDTPTLPYLWRRRTKAPRSVRRHVEGQLSTSVRRVDARRGSASRCSRHEGASMRIRFVCLLLGVLLVPAAAYADSHNADFYGGGSYGGGGSNIGGFIVALGKDWRHGELPPLSPRDEP